MVAATVRTIVAPPDRPTVRVPLRPACATLAEQTEEWLVGRRSFSLAAMATVLQPPTA